MLLTQEQVAEFERNGFLNGGKMISDADLDELTAALDAVLEKGPEGFLEAVRIIKQKAVTLGKEWDSHAAQRTGAGG